MLSIKTRLYIDIINESAKQDYFIEQWANSLYDTKLTKEQIHKMLENVSDSKTLKLMSDYFFSNDGNIYIAYQPNDDDFLNDDSHASIIDKMSEYIYKHISNKIK